MPESPDPASHPARLQLHPKYVKSERLGRRIMEYKAWMNAAEYKWLMMVREFDQEGLWQLEGICSCAHWLNWKCGIGMNAAREKVRVANALAGLPKLSARYAKGEISYSKARAISRIATPENEDYLLMIARHGTAAHVEGLVRKYRRCKRAQDARNARQQHASRELKWYYDDDGSLVIQGRFPPEEGKLVLKAMEVAVDRRDREVKAERRRLWEAAKASAGSVEAGMDVSAETAGGDAVSAETSGGRVSAETGADDSLSPEAIKRAGMRSIRRHLQEHPQEAVRPAEPWSARRADALIELAESYLAAGPKSSSAADRYQVVVHVSAETLESDPPARCTDTAGGHQGPGVSAETPDLFAPDYSWIENGPHVSAETARRLACDWVTCTSTQTPRPAAGKAKRSTGRWPSGTCSIGGPRPVERCRPPAFPDRGGSSRACLTGRRGSGRSFPCYPGRAGRYTAPGSRPASSACRDLPPGTPAAACRCASGPG